jgi:hypothetical protein
MASDSKRIDQVYRDIERIRNDFYSRVVRPQDGREGPYIIIDRPWREVPEGSKLAILLDAVDWSGVTNRDRAHILLAEIDPGKISDAQRNRLIDMAAAKEPGEPAGRQAFERMLEERWQACRFAVEGKGKDKGMER